MCTWQGLGEGDLSAFNFSKHCSRTAPNITFKDCTEGGISFVQTSPAKTCFDTKTPSGKTLPSVFLNKGSKTLGSGSENPTHFAKEEILLMFLLLFALK